MSLLNSTADRLRRANQLWHAYLASTGLRFDLAQFLKEPALEKQILESSLASGDPKLVTLAQDWLAAGLKTLREWKARQIGVCESLGWQCLPSEANFFCAQPALPEGLDLQQALAALRASGIKLRDTTSFGLPGYVRLGVLPPGAQDDLHNAWQQLIKASQ